MASNSDVKDSKLVGLTLKPVGAPTGSRSMEDCYDKIGQVGEGMYGQVYKMRDRDDPKTLVALKKVRMDNEKEGFPITAIREIKILSKFSAENKDIGDKNIVRLKEIVTSKASNENDNKGDIFMVFEYMEHDLAGIRENRDCKFDLATVKLIVRQILHGLVNCHQSGILHRDLKCSNVLMNSAGDVKLADFGLARTTGDKKRMTPKVITLWYRPPELLLGEQEYDACVDMWSAGCIMAELLMEKPLLPGKDEADQIHRIFHMFGVPNESTWPGVTKLSLYERMTKDRNYKNDFHKFIKQHSKHEISPDCLDLLQKLLEMDPKRRITSVDAFYHNWFFENSLHVPLSQSQAEMERADSRKRLAQSLSKVSDSHEYEQRLKRKMEAKARPTNKRFI